MAEHPQLTRSWLSLLGELPARFNGPAGAIPQNVFRPEYVRLPELPLVFVVIDGQLTPCDGKLRRLEADGRRADVMCIGRMFALHVVSERAEPVHFCCRVYGSTVDVPGPVGAELRLGAWLAATPYDAAVPPLAVSPPPEPPGPPPTGEGIVQEDDGDAQ